MVVPCTWWSAGFFQVAVKSISKSGTPQATLVTRAQPAATIGANIFLVLVFPLLRYGSSILHKGLRWALRFRDCDNWLTRAALVADPAKIKPELGRLQHSIRGMLTTTKGSI